MCNHKITEVKVKLFRFNNIPSSLVWKCRIVEVVDVDGDNGGRVMREEWMRRDECCYGDGKQPPIRERAHSDSISLRREFSTS